MMRLAAFVLALLCITATADARVIALLFDDSGSMSGRIQLPAFGVQLLVSTLDGRAGEDRLIAARMSTVGPADAVEAIDIRTTDLQQRAIDAIAARWPVPNGGTPFQQIEMVLRQVAETQQAGEEAFFIIVTDGAFNQGGTANPAPPPPAAEMRRAFERYKPMLKGPLRVDFLLIAADDLEVVAAVEQQGIRDAFLATFNGDASAGRHDISNAADLVESIKDIVARVAATDRAGQDRFIDARGNTIAIDSPLMGWSGRAPAPPGDDAGAGRQQRRSTPMASINTTVAVIGIDIGKNWFHLVGLDRKGAIVLRQKWSRGQVGDRLANMPPCLIGMEACVGAHHLSRKLKGLGHEPRLMPAKYVRPYSKGQKNDFRDAEAIAEAVQRPTMKFVPTKTAEQLDLQALHRVRERLVSQRTGVINQIRAFLLERGIAVRQGRQFLRAGLPTILATRGDVLSGRMQHVIEGLAEDWRRLDERIDRLSTEIEVLVHEDAGAERLMSVPGIGPIISSAMVAAVGTGATFSKGRDFAAWLGLVPKQISTGDRTILGPISRRGNRYLRTLFVQAAWVVLVRLKNWERYGLKSWIEAAKKRLHHNVLAIALANKLARIAWAVLARGRSFEVTRSNDLSPQPA